MPLMPDSPLRQVSLEIEAHVAETGWDQGPRLFALVSTQHLIDQEPGLADQLGVASGEIMPEALTPVEQDGISATGSFEESLAQMMWPEQVAGCAAVLERIMLPPTAENRLPDDPGDVEQFVATHPERQEVRIVAAVDRAGDGHSTVRARIPEDAELLEGPELVPTLLDLLKHTLAD